MDKLTKEQRHRCMSAIHSKDTKPEMLVRKYLFSKGFRYRLHHPRLPGHPDIVLRKYRTVIFVNGCFWHGHDGCKYFVLPKSNVEFWRTKIERNKIRDKAEQEQLNAMGWHCLIVWECQLKAKKREETLKTLEQALRENLVLAKLSKRSVTKADIQIAAEQENNYDFTEEEENIIAAELDNEYNKDENL